jgi:hypothetical protein
MSKDSRFEYNEGTEITKGAFRISASQFSKFFDSTSEWYRTQLMGEEGFTGNTATHLGTAVHAGIESYVTDGDVDWDALFSYINSIEDPEVDIQHILDHHEVMINTALPFVEENMPTEVEKFIFHEILPGIGAGGSLDALTGYAEYCVEDVRVTREVYELAKDQNKPVEVKYPQGATIMDWKTTSAKTPPKKFSRAYWFQQMLYAWVLKQQGITVNYVKLVFISKSEMNRVSEKTGKRLQDYPSVCTVLTEEVTDANLELIGSCLSLIAESVHVWNTQPEMHHLLSQDQRLKAKPKPITFK